MSSPQLQDIANRLKAALLRLDFARNFVKEVITDSVGGSEERDAYERARKAEMQASAECVRILDEYQQCLEREQQKTKHQGAAG